MSEYRRVAVTESVPVASLTHEGDYRTDVISIQTKLQVKRTAAVIIELERGWSLIICNQEACRQLEVFFRETGGEPLPHTLRRVEVRAVLKDGEQIQLPVDPPWPATFGHRDLRRDVEKYLINYWMQGWVDEVSGTMTSEPKVADDPRRS